MNLLPLTLPTPCQHGKGAKNIILPLLCYQKTQYFVKINIFETQRTQSYAMLDVIIRSAQDDDYSCLLDIELDAAKAFKDYPEYAGMCDELDPLTQGQYRPLSKDEGKIYVAEKSGKLIGFVLIDYIDGQPHLKEIDVLQAYAKQGIGTGLLKQAFKWAMDNRFKYMTLTTYRDLVFNGPFYKKHGFEIIQPCEKWPELKKMRQQEIDNGWDIAPRVAMVKTLRNSA